MASLTIRKLEDDTKERLRVRAALSEPIGTTAIT